MGELVQNSMRFNTCADDLTILLFAIIMQWIKDTFVLAAVSIDCHIALAIFCRSCSKSIKNYKWFSLRFFDHHFCDLYWLGTLNRSLLNSQEFQSDLGHQCCVYCCLWVCLFQEFCDGILEECMFVVLYCHWLVDDVKCIR